MRKISKFETTQSVEKKLTSISEREYELRKERACENRCYSQCVFMHAVKSKVKNVDEEMK